MLYASIAIFALAAVAGLTIFVTWLKKRTASRPVVYLHGLLAATALVLLAIFSFNQPENFPKFSLVLFVLAALGGFYMFSRDMRGKSNPLGLAGAHALLAVAGFVLLLIFAFS
jgi:drug/metabolite transporter superfamily protein YnfA